MKQVRLAVSAVILLLGLFMTFLSPQAKAYSAVEYPTARGSVWQVGMLVSVNSKGVTTHSSTTNDNYIGIVSAVDETSIEVATSGTVQVLVTDEAGPVKKGSELYVSRIAGIATSEGGVTTVGVVSEEPVTWSPAQLRSSDKQTVRIGVAQVQLIDQSGGSAFASNPFLATLQKTGNGVAGHTVDMWRIITALILGVGGIILSFGLLFISSRESFFSMGRNPMASTIIMRGLWKIVMLSVIIMCICLGAAYTILRVG